MRSTALSAESALIGAASAAGLGGASPGVGAGDGASGESGQAANGSGYEPSETDCVNVAHQPCRYAPDDLSACGVTAPASGYGYAPGRG